MVDLILTANNKWRCKVCKKVMGKEYWSHVSAVMGVSERQMRSTAAYLRKHARNNPIEITVYSLVEPER